MSGRYVDGSEIDAVETLRTRYANGDIDEIEFEERIESLLDTESSYQRKTELSIE